MKTITKLTRIGWVIQNLTANYRVNFQGVYEFLNWLMCRMIIMIDNYFFCLNLSLNDYNNHHQSVIIHFWTGPLQQHTPNLLYLFTCNHWENMYKTYETIVIVSSKYDCQYVLNILRILYKQKFVIIVWNKTYNSFYPTGMRTKPLAEANKLYMYIKKDKPKIHSNGRNPINTTILGSLH